MTAGPDFGGKVVLVTGVGRAGQIGHAVARAFGQAGARLVLCDRNAVALAERVHEFTAAGMEAHPAAGDLTEPEVAHFVVQAAVRRFGRLDVLVNVAGGLTTYGPIGGTSPDAFDRELDINLKTTYLMSQAAVEALAATRGCIVNFASVAYFRPQPNLAVYAGAKAAVAGFTRALAAELLDRGIRVNAVAPGMVRTGDNVASVGDAPVRWVEMDEITAGVLFLASASASAVTGHVLPLTGAVE